MCTLLRAQCLCVKLQNELASGKLLPRWSPRARLGLNLGPNPTHAWNVYLVLNLITGWVSPQYHCWFNGFFEMTCHSGPDVSNTICRQQLAGLSCAAQILSNLARPTQSSTVSQTIPLENRPDDLDDFSVPQVDFDVMIDGESFADGESQATGSSGDSCTSQAPHQDEGVTMIEPTVTAGTSRSRRIHTMSRKMAESTSQQDFFGTSGMHYMANLSTTAFDETPEDLFHNYHLDLQERIQHPIAFHAEIMGDIMYYDQALQRPDAKQFANAVVKEVNGHVNNKHWTLVKQEDVPKEAQVVSFIWAMQRKCDLTTNKFIKHKARLNLHGGKQVYGMNYIETYAPVVTWFAIRLMIVFGIIFCWVFWQVDFVMAYPQAPDETDIYMKLPQGIKTPTEISKDHVLKLLKNIYDH
jgi:hypothetical protein